MTVQPSYFGTPRNGSGALTLASVGFGPAAPTNVVEVISALTTGVGTRISSIRIAITGQVPVSVVNIFRFDGVNYWLIDQQALPAIALSTTVLFPVIVQPYADLRLAAGATPEQLFAGVTVVPTSGDVIVTAMGADG
jgi:hypothetical protein